MSYHVETALYHDIPTSDISTHDQDTPQNNQGGTDHIFMV